MPPASKGILEAQTKRTTLAISVTALSRKTVLPDWVRPLGVGRVHFKVKLDVMVMTETKGGS